MLLELPGIPKPSHIISSDIVQGCHMPLFSLKFKKRMKPFTKIAHVIQAFRKDPIVNGEKSQNILRCKQILLSILSLKTWMLSTLASEKS